MAVGYEKLNTSAARSNRKSRREDSGDQFVITPKGHRFCHPVFREGVTMEEFVSDCDRVKCQFDNGTIVNLRGGAIRAASR